MPDYRISQAKLLRLATIASGVEPPKFDEVFGILREAKPILDNDELVTRKLADAVGSGVSTGKLTDITGAQRDDPSYYPKGSRLPPVTGIDSIGAAQPVDLSADSPVMQPADDADKPAKPE